MLQRYLLTRHIENVLANGQHLLVLIGEMHTQVQHAVTECSLKSQSLEECYHRKSNTIYTLLTNVGQIRPSRMPWRMDAILLFIYERLCIVASW